MSEPKLISPMLDNFEIGGPISDHDGVRCCPAMRKNSDEKYIVKIISVPASQTKLDALLLTGAYPDKEAARMKELIDVAHRNKVKFVWAIHPGGDIKWTAEDYRYIIEKFELMYGLGVRTFAVFFDDIRGEGTRADKQAELMNYLTDEFVRKYEGVEPLIMCPTQYNRNWSHGDYLTTLGIEMYPEVQIMWTGNSVVDMIEENDMKWINDQIRRKAYIWLNYPVNDYCQSRLRKHPN